MLHWFRLKASCLAATVLVSLGAMGISLLAPHPLDCHDGDCEIGVVHDASAHRIGTADRPTTGEPFHCLVCHWARSFRPNTETRYVASPGTQTRIRVTVVTVTASPAAPLAQPPLRSPPASTVLS
jgi:hypothetical protein